MTTSDLRPLGWNKEAEAALRDAGPADYQPARVIADFGLNYRLAAPDELIAEMAGRLRHELAPTQQPKVGDWVLIARSDTGDAVIQAVLPRRTEIARLLSDRSRRHRRPQRQILAVNVDLAFLVQAMDQDFSPARLERYLFQLAKDGIRAIIILNKADKADDIGPAVAQLEQLGLPVIVASARTGLGMEAIQQAITPGQTAVFLGSSGVGKSTITNRLLGEERQTTQEVRASDSKGRHTTSHRELFRLPGGGLLIDTPGLRELQLWGSERELETVFPDIEALAPQCQFQDCAHDREPDCAVLAAIEAGKLDPERLASYRRFRAELNDVSVNP
ncbi:MAG: ribosome small subunit-dependent GTPase [Patescibacteria group bacterium]|nr:ribosome small subunit-dependent GTPase [Patescibacteria group bacterium]